jgi:hypothetical protein
MKMALGLNTSSSAGGDFLPIAKFDCRAGRMFRRDREGGENIDVDITKTFKAVIDFENLEVGWIDFDTGGAPSFALGPLGEKPEKPSEKHKDGVRFVVKLAKECGGDVREMASTAKAFLRGLDELHDAYEVGVQKNPGKLPVVVLKDTVAVTTGEGARKSTNYSPVFEITAWVARPADLKPQTRSPAPAPARASAPSTGSTKVSAPQAAFDEEDFG